MLRVLRVILHWLELVLAAPIRLGRLFLVGVVLNPRLGPLRHLFTIAAVYVVFAVTLVYVVAPLRGWSGQVYAAEKLRYDAERWLATAVYDAKGNFVGTFDPRLDSQRDVNFSGTPIEVGSYVANPDHKSIPVRNVPEYYWNCLVYQEDRHLGGWLNPAGIDLLGVLKIPYSTLKRTIRRRRLSLGVGGSTLPMQLARVIYNTPPHPSESPVEKLGRKLREWWLAPVIYHELTRGGDKTRLRQWAANHIWLAQRTGGSSLHGVEIAARIIFGKEARDLSIAEQFVLASAVNKPIILLPGSDRLNRVRLDRWRYIAEVRARKCAEALLHDDETRKQVLFELIGLADGPPDPRVKPRLQKALAKYSPRYAKPARANPVIRANVLMPAARLGIREQMKQIWGFGWRNHVRGVTTTLDVAENLALRAKLQKRLKKLDETFAGHLNPGYTLDPAKARGPDADKRAPDIIVAAAMPNGEIIRYYESGHTAPYFGSPSARDPNSGLYLFEEESRQIASTGKIIAAIAIANTFRDGPNSGYIDSQAPASGLKTCRRKGKLRRSRLAITSFACSLSSPIEWRLARVGQKPVRRLIDRFGFNMPPAPTPELATPPSTAAVRGLIAGSPRRVHQMSGVVLAALMGKGYMQVRPPTLVKDYDYINPDQQNRTGATAGSVIIPNDLIKPRARAMVKRFLQAPLCYRLGKTSHGTLKSLSRWCAARRADLRFHFAKTGTAVTADPDSTIDTWVTGGLQFSNGAAYSYVVVVGTGSAVEPWA
ncbi:MAG TPA: glycosyl transferase family 51, partial [Rhizobiales bacterium]|nr:glycosyl transferase family 51 [Hyphomicrobiales bacterium]